MLAYLVVSGRASGYLSLFAVGTRGNVDRQAVNGSFVTGLLWMAGLAPQTQAFAKPPQDDHWSAMAWGSAVAILVPTFFASFARDLRSPAALAWLGVTGLLMGLGTYCRRRAMAYLRDEPERGAFFREWRLLNPARYEERGRVFVRWQIAVSVALPFWWLGVGATMVFR